MQSVRLRRELSRVQDRSCYICNAVMRIVNYVSQGASPFHFEAVRCRGLSRTRSRVRQLSTLRGCQINETLLCNKDITRIAHANPRLPTSVSLKTSRSLDGRRYHFLSKQLSLFIPNKFLKIKLTSQIICFNDFSF